MGKKLTDIILTVLLVVAVATSVASFLLKKATIAERVATEERLFQEKVVTKKAEEKLSRAEKERDGLKQSVETLKEKALRLEQEIITYRNEISSSSVRIKKAETDTIYAQRKIKQDASGVAEFKNRITNIIKDSLKLTEELRVLQKAIEAMKLRLSEYAEEQLPALEVSDQEDIVQAIPGLSGEVLTVNREFSFLVVSLGAVDGIEEGMLLTVARDDTNFGKAKVETVRDNISAIALLDKDMISQVRAGDSVFTPYKA